MPPPHSAGVGALVRGSEPHPGQPLLRGGGHEDPLPGEDPPPGEPPRPAATGESTS
jgi:hypothetical protein